MVFLNPRYSKFVFLVMSTEDDRGEYQCVEIPSASPTLQHSNGHHCIFAEVSPPVLSRWAVKGSWSISRT